jgi:hypothetical protein
MAMIFMPFPRFVAPISNPPPLAITKVASMKHSSSFSAHAISVPARSGVPRHAQMARHSALQAVSTRLRKRYFRSPVEYLRFVRAK